MIGKRLKLAIATVVLLAAWVWASPFLATNLIVERRLPVADAIVVLAGSSAYRERSKLAARLYAELNASTIFISDDGGRAGWSEIDKANLSFVTLTRRELISSGVPDDAIVQLPDTMTGTDSEARAFRRQADGLPVQSVVLVTSPYHTRRVNSTFQRALAGTGIEIGIVPTPIDPSSPKPQFWWLTLTGWQNVAGEYVKLAGYSVFY